MGPIRRASLVLLLLTGAVPMATRAASVDQLVDAFMRIVDSTEFRFDKTVRLEGATKWTIPIEYNVVGAIAAANVAEVDAQMARLAFLTGLSIRRNPGFVLDKQGERRLTDDVHPLTNDFEFALWREDATRRGLLVNAVIDGKGAMRTAWLGNLTIMFGSRESLARIFGQLSFSEKVRQRFANGDEICFSAILFPERSRQPKVAVVLIPTGIGSRLMRRCLIEETTQVLGLSNDIPGSTLTLFDDKPDRGRTELTANDEMFLRVLYSAEIKLGMTGAELRRVARRLIAAELETSR
jgi:hypothetical protein